MPVQLDQVPKDPVTLDDLKRAIEHAESWLAHKNGSPDSINFARRYESARAEAWRTAFEWRDYFGGNVNRSCGCKSCREDCAEYDEGLRLIREKLQQ